MYAVQIYVCFVVTMRKGKGFTYHGTNLLDLLNKKKKNPVSVGGNSIKLFYTGTVVLK